MLAFFSLLLTVVGCINWLSIALLQFDFVAGLFGSQSSVISRIIYFVIGVAALTLTFLVIKGKGHFQISFKKKEKMQSSRALPQAENSSDMGKQQFDDEDEDE